MSYDAVNKKLSTDLLKSSLKGVHSRDPLAGTGKHAEIIQHFYIEGESVKFHIFIDKALIQAYANDQKTVTPWSYPSFEESKGLEIWADGGNAKVKLMQVWEMKFIYYY